MKTNLVSGMPQHWGYLQGNRRRRLDPPGVRALHSRHQLFRPAAYHARHPVRAELPELGAALVPGVRGGEVCAHRHLY